MVCDEEDDGEGEEMDEGEEGDEIEQHEMDEGEDVETRKTAIETAPEPAPAPAPEPRTRPRGRPRKSSSQGPKVKRDRAAEQRVALESQREALGQSTEVLDSRTRGDKAEAKAGPSRRTRSSSRSDSESDSG